MMDNFLASLKTQRWDDHRYYHHSRINQTLHLVSALSFLVSYALVFKHPAAAAIVAWMVAMTSRQSGHFFFEPKGYDQVNRATHEHKEKIKVGYNLRRKVVLLAVWAFAPIALWVDPTLFGAFPPPTGLGDYVEHVGMAWFWIGVGGLAFRTLQLMVIKDVETGIVWMTKILTDPFHDVMLYWRAPLYLLQGELIDPMHDVLEHEASPAARDA
jgi:hypothetical protein